MFVEHWISVFYRYSEDCLGIVTQDSMTIREIGEILCCGNAKHWYFFISKIFRS